MEIAILCLSSSMDFMRSHCLYMEIRNLGFAKIIN